MFNNPTEENPCEEPCAENKYPPATPPKKIKFKFITCQELDAGNYDMEYLIDGLLVARQPLIIAGPKKVLKTSVLIDLGVSLSEGVPFLNTNLFKINRRVRVGIMTGESGMGTIRETARRIQAAKGVFNHSDKLKLIDNHNLGFCEDLPKFNDPAHLEAVKDFIIENKLEVLIIDPAYLCMVGGSPENLFAQGAILIEMNKVCTSNHCLMALAHHNKKLNFSGNRNPYSIPDLEDIAYAGFQEWARQWILLGRRCAYEDGSGKHHLYMRVGGSAGHSACFSVNIEEGHQPH